MLKRGTPNQVTGANSRPPFPFREFLGFHEFLVSAAVAVGGCRSVWSLGRNPQHYASHQMPRMFEGRFHTGDCLSSLWVSNHVGRSVTRWRSFVARSSKPAALSRYYAAEPHFRQADSSDSGMCRYDSVLLHAVGTASWVQRLGLRFTEAWFLRESRMANPSIQRDHDSRWILWQETNRVGTVDRRASVPGTRLRIGEGRDRFVPRFGYRCISDVDYWFYLAIRCTAHQSWAVGGQQAFTHASSPGLSTVRQLRHSDSSRGVALSEMRMELAFMSIWPNKLTGANSRPASQFAGRRLRRCALVVESHGRHHGGAAVAQFCR